MIDDKARTVIRSLGSGLLLESEFLLSAAEDARARKNEVALALEWNQGYESRQAEIEILQERYQTLEQENLTLRRLVLNPSPQATSPPEVLQEKSTLSAMPLEARMGMLLGM